MVLFSQQMGVLWAGFGVFWSGEQCKRATKWKSSAHIWDPLMSQIFVFCLPLLCHLGTDAALKLYSWAIQCSGRLSLLYVGSIDWAWLYRFLSAVWLYPRPQKGDCYFCVLYFDPYKKWIVLNFELLRTITPQFLLNYDGPLLIKCTKRGNQLLTDGPK